MTLIICTQPECQTTAGCICARQLRPIRLPMCKMRAAFVQGAGNGLPTPNAMVCAEDECRYPHCPAGGEGK